MSHPDEGLIHAWLDGELDAAEAARVEALVKGDPAWAAAAAEARGFIAASARIVSALDDVPAGVVPKPAPATVSRIAAIAPRRTPAWWMLRAAAAIVIVTSSAIVMSKAGEIDGLMTDPPAKDEAASAPSVVAEAKQKVAPAPTAVASTPASANERDQRRENALGDAAAGSRQQVAQDQRVQQQPLQVQGQLGQQALGGAGAGAPARADGPPAAPRAVADSVSLSRNRSIDSLQKKAAESNLKLEAVVATGASSERSALAAKAAPIVECYREASTNVVFRVQRVSDSTATAVELPALQSQTFRRPAAGADLAPAAPRPVALLRLNGDTLFVPTPRGTASRATKISCPQP
jgi:anti-sigma factor RsiW